MAKNKVCFNLMEVCGTHTMSIARNGLRPLFPKDVVMLTGPGCPICVTPNEDIDRAIALARIPGVIITTFGDMLHVPGSHSSLERERAAGADVRIVYSCADALDIAIAEPKREVVFMGVGFETTAPTIAATVLTAAAKKVKNFTVLAMFKTVPEALKALLEIPGRRIHGFLLPGHVSAIIGIEPYRFIAEKYGVPGVIAGFEPSEILSAVTELRRMCVEGKAAIVNGYSRVVKPEGNPAARAILEKVLEPADCRWRVVGNIPGSGLKFRPAYAAFDALKRFKIKTEPAIEPKGCACGKILLGLCGPRDCALFAKRCTPGNPVGPCMVSSEGACAAEYKYGSAFHEK